MKLKNKYNAQGVRDPEYGYFHSQKEHARFYALKLLERGGEIGDLKRQVPVPLYVNGQLIATMKIDFRYTELKGGHANQIVDEDSKGYQARGQRDWDICAKLYAAIYGKEIRIT